MCALSVSCVTSYNTFAKYFGHIRNKETNYNKNIENIIVDAHYFPTHNV